MVPPKELARHSSDGHSDGFPTEEVHQREVEGGVRLSPEVLEELDEECSDI